MAAPNPLVTEGSTLNCILARSIALAQKNNPSPYIDGASDLTVSIAFTGCVVLIPKEHNAGAARQQLTPVVGSLCGLGDKARGPQSIYAGWTFGGINNSTFPHQDANNSLTTDELIAQISEKASVHCFRPWLRGQCLEWVVPEDTIDARSNQRKYKKTGVPDGTCWAELRPVDAASRYPDTKLLKVVLDKIDNGEDDPMYEREATGLLLLGEVLTEMIADIKDEPDDTKIVREYLQGDDTTTRGSKLSLLAAAFQEITKPATERFVG